MSYDLRYSKRYRLDVSRGIDRSYVAPGPVREHVTALEAAGLTRRSIAVLAGVSPQSVTRLMRGDYDSMQRRVADALLRVRADRVLNRPDPEGFVPALGARRRIRALLAIGWTHETMAAAAGLHAKKTALVLNQAGDLVARVTHDQIDAAYHQLSMTPGPSRLTRLRAARLGYPPPLAWDDETLDDPDGLPAPGWRNGECAQPGCPDTEPWADGLCRAHYFQRRRGSDGTGPADLDEFLHLVRCGENLDRAAGRLGVQVNAIESRARREGRTDVLDTVRLIREGVAA